MTETLSRSTLHCEVLYQSNEDDFTPSDVIRNEVSQWLLFMFTDLQIGQNIDGYDTLPHGALVSCISVVDCSGPSQLVYSLDTVALDVQAYQLHDDESGRTRGRIPSLGEAAEDDESRTRIITLPNVLLKDDWDSLIFDEPIPARLLRYATRMISLTTQAYVDARAFHFSRVMLLHGPPGTGKSTLCRALAQKITIRLGEIFFGGKLVEINANALLSKWFSESGKLVSQVFDQIQRMSNDESTFICVLVDEVESLAGRRDSSTDGSDCKDSMRATNQLLTALDRLSHRPNVLVLCTSNMWNAIDPAFLDRVDVKQHISNPCQEARYDILSSCLNSLGLAGLITTEPTTSPLGLMSSPVSSSQTDWQMVNVASVPNFATTTLHRWLDTDSHGRRIHDIAQLCSGMSGRTLRRLPFLALAMYTYGQRCSLEEAIQALGNAVQDELRGNMKSAGIKAL